MKLSERLLARLRAEGIVPADADVEMRRMNASRSQRENGSWSWFGQWQEGVRPRTVGSQFPMSQCLASQAWDVDRNRWREFSEISIDPSAADRRKFREARQHQA
jgi:hypothetical protein